MAYDLLAMRSASRNGGCGTKILVALPCFLGLLVSAGCGRDGVNGGGTGGTGKGGASGGNDGAVLSDAAGTSVADAWLPAGGAGAGGRSGSGGLFGTGGQTAAGGMTGAGGLPGSGGTLDAGGQSARAAPLAPAARQVRVASRAWMAAWW